MQHLRGADAIDDLDAEMVGPALADVLRQGFAGRGAQAQRHVALLRQVGGGEHAAVTGGRAVEHRGPLVLEALEAGLRCGALGHQHHAGAHAEREAQRVAQAVGEEQLGGGEHHIVLTQREHALAIQLGGPVKIGLGVHRALGRAGGARGIQPERRLVAVRVGGLRCGRVAAHQGGEVVHALGQRAGGARGDEVLHLVAALSAQVVQRGLQRGQQRGRHQGSLRAAVGHHVRVVLRGQQGVHRHRHHTGVQRAQECDHPVAAVVHEQQHALFAPQAQRGECAGETAHLVGEFAVAELPQVVDQGGLARASCVEFQQVAREVEALGGRRDVGVHGDVSSAVRGVRSQYFKATAEAASASSAALLACTALRRW